MTNPLLIDVGAVSDHATDAGLEAMYKAMAEPPRGPEDPIWQPHHSPLMRSLIEWFSKSGTDALDALGSATLSWIKGEKHKYPMRTLKAKVPDMAHRWDKAGMEEVEGYLASMPPASFSLTDWDILVEWLMQKYLPAGFVASHAEWMAVHATLMGPVEATAPAITLAQADNVLAAMPSTVAAAEQAFGLTPLQTAVLEFGRARCAENIVALTDGVRHKIKNLILQDREAHFLGDHDPETLQQKLLYEFAEMNRDWRRIAVTEACEMQNQGFIATVAPGRQVKRLEQYFGACPWCKKIDGMVFTVVPPTKEYKDGTKEVWVGKTNIGRSSSPRKRVGGVLVERDPSELYWVAAGVQHPLCRGSWINQKTEAELVADPKWAAWLESLGVQAPSAPPVQPPPPAESSGT